MIVRTGYEPRELQADPGIHGDVACNAIYTVAHHLAKYGDLDHG